jgi:hypothetical protein
VICCAANGSAARRATCGERRSRSSSAASAPGAGRTTKGAAGRASDPAARPRGRTRSRAASCAGEGTRIGSSSPPASRRASLRASRGSVLTRSSGRCGTSPGPTPAIETLLDKVTVETKAGRARAPNNNAPPANGAAPARLPARRRPASAPRATPRCAPPPAGSNPRAHPAQPFTVLDSLTVGDLRMWLYRANPGNPRQMRRRPLSPAIRTPQLPGLRLHPV